MTLDVRALEYKEVRSLMMMLLMNQKSLIDLLRVHLEQDHSRDQCSESAERLRRLDNRLDRFMDELTHISDLIRKDSDDE